MTSSSFDHAMYQFPPPMSDTGKPCEPAIESMCPAPPCKSAASAPGGICSQRNGGSSNQKKIRVSWINCQRKKVKCDRADPCSRCVRLGAICVSSPPSRVPRGRNGGRRKADHKLLDRISKLENLIKGIEVQYSEKAEAIPAEEKIAVGYISIYHSRSLFSAKCFLY